jgi:hypothetical protein
MCGCSLRRDGRFRGGGTKSMGGCGLAREEPPPHGRESTTMPPPWLPSKAREGRPPLPWLDEGRAGHKIN